MTNEERYAQWRAFDKVLSWLQTQDGKTVRRSVIYHAVMEMRPE